MEQQNNNQNVNEVGLPNAHSITLQKLLSQVDSLNVTEESKARLRDALAAGIEALKATSGGLELSQDDANDHLMRVVSGETGRTRAKAARNQQAVIELAALVDQVPHGQDEGGASAVNTLARLVRNEG